MHIIHLFSFSFRGSFLIPQCLNPINSFSFQGLFSVSIIFQGLFSVPITIQELFYDYTMTESP